MQKKELKEKEKEREKSRCINERCIWEAGRFNNGSKETILCSLPVCPSPPLFSFNVGKN